MILALLALAGCAHRAPAPVAPVEAPAPAPRLDPAVRTVLEAGAADLDVGVRRRALATLIATDDAPAGGPWALRARFDPSEYVRRAAIEALDARLAEPETRALLRAIVDDAAADPWTRGSAALALADGIADGRVPAAEHADDRARIVAAAGSVKGTRAGAVLLAAARLGDTDAATRLAALLARGELPLELWFLRALGAAPDPALTTALVTALPAVEPELRLAVAATLLEHGDSAGERALAEALAADEDTALEALDYLAEARSPRAAALLRGTALAAPLVRDAAAALRFAHGDAPARDLLKALAHEEPEVRVFAARAAARGLRVTPEPDGAARLRDALRDALPDAGGTLELALVDALGGSRAPPDRAALTALLDSESSRIRVEAAASLAR